MSFDDIFADIFPKKEPEIQAPKPNPCPDTCQILDELLTYLPEKDENTPQLYADVNPMPFLNKSNQGQKLEESNGEDDGAVSHDFDPFDFLSRRKNGPFKKGKKARKKKRKRGSTVPTDPDFDEEAFLEEYGEFLIDGGKKKSNDDAPDNGESDDGNDEEWDAESNKEFSFNPDDVTREKIDELRDRVARGDLHLRGDLAHMLALYTSDPTLPLPSEEIQQLLNEALELLNTLIEEGELEYRGSYAKVLLNQAACLVTEGESPISMTPITNTINYINGLINGVDDQNELQFLLAMAYRIQSAYYMRNDLPSAGLTSLLESEKIWDELATTGDVEYLSSQASVYADIADTMMSIGDNEGAVEYYRMSAYAWKDLDDDDPTALPECVNALNRLAQCLKPLHRLTEASRVLDEALTLERLLAEEEPERYTSGLIQLLDAKCEYYYKLSSYGEVIKIQKEISDSYERFQATRNSPITPETCRTRGEMIRKKGIAYQSAEQYRSAHQCFREALAWVWQMKTLYAVDIRYMATAIGLDESMTYFSEGYYQDAYDIVVRLERLIQVMTSEKTAAQYPVIYPHILLHTAEVCEKLGRLDEAGSMLDRYLEYWQEIVEDEGYVQWTDTLATACNKRVDFALRHKGDLNRALDDAIKSRRLLRALVEDEGKNQGERYQNAIRNHALVLDALGRKEEAKEAIRSCFAPMVTFINRENWGRLREFAELGLALLALYEEGTPDDDMVAVCDKLLADLDGMERVFEKAFTPPGEEDDDDLSDESSPEASPEEQARIEKELTELLRSNKDLIGKILRSKDIDNDDSLDINELFELDKKLNSIPVLEPRKKKKPHLSEDPLADQKKMLIAEMFEEARTRIRCARLDYKEERTETQAVAKSLGAMIDRALAQVLHGNRDMCDTLYSYVCEYVKLQMMLIDPQTGVNKLDDLVRDMRYRKSFDRSYHFHEKYCAFFELYTHLLEHGEGLMTGDLDDAYDMYFSYCRMGQEEGNMSATYNLCRISLNRVFWLQIKNRVPEARRILTNSLPLLKRCMAAGYPDAELLHGKTLSFLARFQSEMGETALAAQNAEAAMKIFRKYTTDETNLELTQYRADTLRLLGSVYRKRQEPKRSIDCYRDAADLFLQLAEKGSHDELRFSVAEVHFLRAQVYIEDPAVMNSNSALAALETGWEIYLQVPETYRIDMIRKTLDLWSELLREAMRQGKESLIVRLADMIDTCCEKFTQEIPAEKIPFVIDLEMNVAATYVTTGRLDTGSQVLDHVKNFCDRGKKEFIDHDAVNDLFLTQCALAVMEVWIAWERRDYVAAREAAARIRPEIEFRLNALRLELRRDYTEEVDAWYHTLNGHYLNLRMNDAVALLDSGQAKEALLELDSLRDLAFDMLDSQVDILLTYATIQSNRSDTLRRLHMPERAVSTADIAIEILEASSQRGTPLVDGLLAEALRFRAVAKWHSGYLEDAITDAQRSVLLLRTLYDKGAGFVAPELGRSLFVRGRLLYANKQVPEADADLNRGIAMFRERVTLGQRHFLKQLKEFIP
ncbi:MAG: hypothetical protein Q4G68_07860 [Planctomycetia bacterium]|nr:hypothetical protein [Planctomycetia bacterium]